jgi:hypothetical protein
MYDVNIGSERNENHGSPRHDIIKGALESWQACKKKNTLSAKSHEF